MRYAALAVLLAIGSAAQASSITDLTEWTLLQDPPNPGLSATIDSPSQATLSLNGVIPPGTGIGYASVDGEDVPSSTSGFFFDPTSDFEIAIDYDLSFASLIGAGDISFAIGEDIVDNNSARIVLLFANANAISSGLMLGASSSTNGVVSTQSISNAPGPSQGRFFLAYEAVSGNVTVGVNPTPGSSAASETAVFPGVQQGWTGTPLFASFFLNHQLTISAINPGGATAVFRNLEVFSGTPISIPEPGTTLLASLALVASWRFPRTR